MPIGPFADGIQILDCVFCRLREEKKITEGNTGEGALFCTESGLIFVSHFHNNAALSIPGGIINVNPRACLKIPYREIIEVNKKLSIFPWTRKLRISTSDSKLTFDIGRLQIRNLFFIIKEKKVEKSNEQFPDELMTKCVVTEECISRFVSKGIGKPSPIVQKIN